MVLTLLSKAIIVIIEPKVKCFGSIERKNEGIKPFTNKIGFIEL
jgi:hypothetical protein